MPDLADGSTIAGCTIEAVAGRGGMGVVYRARQVALGRRVAVKAIAGDLAGDGDYRERFERESRIAAAIDHPNIIPVYEAGESDGTLYLIMRWVDGTDLRTLLRSSGPLAPVRAVRLLRPVAAALSAAHRAGLVHRDIKPANVLIARGDSEDEEHVYLTDFGIARRTSGESAMTRTGMFVGTIDYTAPERIEGGKGDAASDVYSFGCMLFETLTGHVPYDRPSEVAKVFAHINDPVPSARAEAPKLPDALDAIIARAMAKDPALRFASAHELAGELGEVLHELDTEERALLAGPTAPATAPAATSPAAPATAPATTTMASPAAPTAPVPPAPAPPPPPSPLDRSEMRIQRVRRRWPIALLAAVVAVAAIVAIVIAATGGGGTSNAGGTISGAGISEGPTVDIGGSPAALSTGPGGNVWASLPDDGEVVRVSAAVGHARAFSVGGHPSAIAASPIGLWVAGSGAGPLARFNLRTGRLERTAQLTSAPSLLAIDPSDSSVWAVDSNGAVVHLSAAGATLGGPTGAGLRPAAVDAGEPNWLWAAAPRGLVRIGNATPATTFDAGPDPVAVALDAGVWTAHADGHVTRFDPRPGYLRVNTDRTVAPELDAIAAVEGGSAVWTISKQTKTLYRLSISPGAPVSGTVTFSSPPVALAATDGGVWVATGDGKVARVAG